MASINRNASKDSGESNEITHHWPWIYEGNGPLMVMCEPIPSGKPFKRNGTAWYYFVNGSMKEETHKQKDIYDRVFVKIGICKGCLNAGPAGFQCEWLVSQR